jgi:osmotically inducible protein OsmC
MPIRSADAEWHGTLKEGHGHMRFGGGAYDGQYSFSSRFESGSGTNPEELIAAAHAGCFSMALSADLGRAGFIAKTVRTVAKVNLGTVDGAATIIAIELVCGANVPGIDKAAFAKIAALTAQNCPVSKALKAVKITLDATLES